MIRPTIEKQARKKWWVVIIVNMILWSSRQLKSRKED